MSLRASRPWALLRLAVRRVIGRRGRTALLLLALVVNQLLVLLAFAAAGQAAGELEYMTAHGSFGRADLEINRTREAPFQAEQLAAIRARPNVAGVFVGRSDDYPLDHHTALAVYAIDPEEASRCRVYRISRGRYLQKHDTHAIVVGEAFAAAHRWRLGGELRLGAGQAAYTIVGLASEHGLVREGDARRGIAFVCAPASVLPCDDISFLLVCLADPARADQTVESLKGYLGPDYPVRRTTEAGKARFTEISAWVGRALIVVTTTALGILLFVSAVLAVHLGRDDKQLYTLWQAGGFSRGGLWALVLLESGLVAALAAGIGLALNWLGRAAWAQSWLGARWGPSLPGPATVWFVLLGSGMWGALILGRCVGMTRGKCRDREEPCGTLPRRWGALVSLVLGLALVVGLGAVLRTRGRFLSDIRLIWMMSAASLSAAALLAYGLGSLVVWLVRRLLRRDGLRVRFSPLGLAVSVIEDSRVTACGLIGCCAAVLGLAFLLQATMGVILRAEAWASARTALLSFSSGTPEQNAVLLEKIDPAVRRIPVTMAPLEWEGHEQVMVAGIPYESLRAYQGFSESSDRGESLSERTFHGGCLLSAALAFARRMGPRDAVLLQRGETRVSLQVLALLPPPVPAGSIVCDARLLHDRFAIRGPTHYLLVLPQGMTSAQVATALLASADHRDRFRIRDLQETDTATATVLHRARQWLWRLVGCLLALGAAGAGDNVGLQSALSRYQSYFRELGASVGRVTGEACLAVLWLVLVGILLGAVLGHVQAALISRWLFHSLALGPPGPFRALAQEGLLVLMGGAIVLVVSFLVILIAGRSRGPDTSAP